MPPEIWCLNPYFNGTCSKSIMKCMFYLRISTVLILILMEHAQRGQRQKEHQTLKSRQKS